MRCAAVWLLFLVWLLAGRVALADKQGKDLVRVVSLAPSLTELVFALGAGDLLVGNTEFCNYPAEARKKPKVGGFSSPSLERILAQKPSLVLWSNGTSPDLLASLKRVGVNQFDGRVERVSELPELIRKLGVVLKADEGGRRLAARVEGALDRLRGAAKARVNAPRFLLAVQLEPWISVTDESWLGDLFSMAGLVNVVPRGPIVYPQISREFLLKADPDVVFVDVTGVGEGVSAAVLERQVRARFSSNSRLKVVPLPQDILVRPGPRIVDGVDFLLGLSL